MREIQKEKLFRNKKHKIFSDKAFLLVSSATFPKSGMETIGFSNGQFTKLNWNIISILYKRIFLFISFFFNVHTFTAPSLSVSFDSSQFSHFSYSHSKHMKFIGWKHLNWWCGFELLSSFSLSISFQRSDVNGNGMLYMFNTWTCIFERPPNFHTVDHKCHKIFALFVDCELIIDHIHVQQMYFSWGFLGAKTDKESTIHTFFEINEITVSSFLCKINISILIPLFCLFVFFLSSYIFAFDRVKMRGMRANEPLNDINSISRITETGTAPFWYIYDIGCINSQKWITNRW